MKYCYSYVYDSKSDQCILQCVILTAMHIGQKNNNIVNLLECGLPNRLKNRSIFLSSAASALCLSMLWGTDQDSSGNLLSKPLNHWLDGPVF